MQRWSDNHCGEFGTEKGRRLAHSQACYTRCHGFHRDSAVSGHGLMQMYEKIHEGNIFNNKNEKAIYLMNGAG